MAGYGDSDDDSTNENDTEPTVPHTATTKNEQKEDQTSANNQNGTSLKERKSVSFDNHEKVVAFDK
eukprot:14396686-Ditylum_brightwellii.AAC.1